MLTKRSEWELVSLHKERHARVYPCCKEAYPDIEFTMVMKRRSPMMFYSASLALTTLALIVAVISMNLSRCPHPPPAALKRLFSGFLGKLLCVCDNQQSRSQTNKDTEAANHEQEWLNVTRAIDHLAFYGCIVVFVVLALAFH
ncbi:UNVERIFIED_CONTAM: hypothetical protein B566_EDAN018312 [Ephemera danica]|nr:hypothetical protein B566_EDAN018312 [Ephemera danica]